MIAKVHAFLLVLLACQTGFLQPLLAQFSVNAQLRSRFMVSGGYQHLIPDTVSPSFVISQRTRLAFGYENKFLKVRITPQDVRVWGSEQTASSTGIFGNPASLDLFEGYLEVRAAKWVWISVGRQELVYDSERILGARNWNQAGIAYDAVVAKLGLGKWRLHLGGSWNTMENILYDNIYPSSRIKSLDFAWLSWEISGGIRASLLHVASAVTKSDTTNPLYWKQTSGIFGEVRWKGLKCWADGFYQYGSNNTGLPVSAFLFDVSAEYTVRFFTPGIGISYLSGNRVTGSDLVKDHLFDVLYGARHRYFGYMDYFRNFPKDTKQGGLIDYIASLRFNVLKKVNILNMVHYFQLAQVNTSTPDCRDLAFENDFVVRYTFNAWGNLEFGYMFMLPTPGFRTMQGVEENAFAQACYLQLTIIPNLFTHSFDH